MRSLITILCVVSFLCAPLLSTDSQAQILIGPRAGFDLGDTDEVFIGADLRVNVPGAPVALIPAFDFYFTDPTAFNIDINAVYYFEGDDRGTFTPYAGTGLGFYRVDTPNGWEGDTGLNLLGGIEVGTGEFRPYLQAKTNFGGDVTLANLMIGFIFRL